MKSTFVVFFIALTVASSGLFAQSPMFGEWKINRAQFRQTQVNSSNPNYSNNFSAGDVIQAGAVFGGIWNTHEAIQAGIENTARVATMSERLGSLQACTIIMTSGRTAGVNDVQTCDTPHSGIHLGFRSTGTGSDGNDYGLRKRTESVAPRKPH